MGLAANAPNSGSVVTNHRYAMASYRGGQKLAPDSRKLRRSSLSVAAGRADVTAERPGPPLYRPLEPSRFALPTSNGMRNRPADSLILGQSPIGPKPQVR